MSGALLSGSVSVIAATDKGSEAGTPPTTLQDAGMISLPVEGDNILLEGELTSANLKDGQLVIAPAKFQNSAGRSGDIAAGKTKTVYITFPKDGTPTDDKSVATEWYRFQGSGKEFIKIAPPKSLEGETGPIQVIGENDPRGKALGLYAKSVVLKAPLDSTQATVVGQKIKQLRRFHFRPQNRNRPTPRM